MTSGADPMRFAIIGCGVIGQTHAHSITGLIPDAELVVAVDGRRERAAAFAAQFGAEYTTSIDEALARADVDTVAICTPSGTHAELAIAALEAGKHVIIEKPVDVTLAAAARIAAAQRRTGRTVTVISQHRFDPSSELVHRAVADGRLGRITSGVASVAWWRTQRYYDSGDWRGTWALDGGGALMNQGIHTLDLLIWMLGDPVEVFAWTGLLAHQGIEVEDTAVATIRFANGSLGVVHATTTAYPGISARLQIHGDRGSAVIDNDRLIYFHAASEDLLDADYGAVGDANQAHDMLPGQAAAPAATADPTALSEIHAVQYRDFLDAVAQARTPRVTIAEATKTLAVILAIYQSANTGRPALLDPTATEA